MSSPKGFEQQGDPPLDLSPLSAVTNMGPADAATLWSDLGFHPVVLHGINADLSCTCGRSDCIRSAGKHPVASSWQRGKLDMRSVQRTLDEHEPRNIGLRMGVQPNGGRLLAIDDDGGLTEFEKNHGAMPLTLTLTSGSGGKHRLYNVPSDATFKNSTKVHGLALDLRCDGGQIVVAPSLHRSGNHYSVGEVHPIADLPSAFVDLLAEKPAPTPVEPNLSTWTLGELRNRDERVLAYCRRKAEEDLSIQGDNGSAALTRWAGVVFWRMGLGEAEGLPLLAEMNRVGASPPWSDAELRHAARSGMSPHPSRPEPRGHLLDEWARQDEKEREERRQQRPRTRGAAPTHPPVPADSDWGPEPDAYFAEGPDADPGVRRQPAAQGTSQPVIFVKARPDEPHVKLDRLVDIAARALGERASEIYCRGGALVDVGHSDIYVGKGADKRRKTASLLTTRELPVSQVRLLLSRVAEWRKWSRSPTTKQWLALETDPPIVVAETISKMGRWPTVRPLTGVITAPSLRPDGSVIQTPGWDSATGYLYAPTATFPPIAPAPTLEDAQVALAELRQPFAEFPWATDADSYGPVCAVLSMLARPAIEGPVPALLFEASTPGSGKTLSADVICTIATGEPMPKATFPDREDELEKMLAGFAVASCSVVGWDNVDVPLKGAALNKVLTATLVQLRILGRTETPTHTWRAVMLATGNNIAVLGDTVRRCLRFRQEPDCEKPEERDGFTIKNLEAYAREHRPRLVCAALTLLRAYFVAGQPAVQTKRFGSFDAWQSVVANAIIWAGGADVIRCRTDGSEGGDPELDATHNLVHALAELGRPVTAAELVAAGYDTTAGQMGHVSEAECPKIREALDVLVSRKDNAGRPSSKSVGRALGRMRGRIFGGLKLIGQSASHRGGGAKSLEWVAGKVGSTGVTGLSGVSQGSSRARMRDEKTVTTEGGPAPLTPETPERPERSGKLIELFRGPLGGTQ